MDNPYIGLDGENYQDIGSLNQANELYWNRVLVPESVNFPTLNGEQILIPPSIQIAYYKNVFAYLKNPNLSYQEWERYYNQFTTKLGGNSISAELALLYATVLQQAQVKLADEDETYRMGDQIANLVGIICSLKEYLGETRK